ncbi:CAP domain-containing protein [Streptomyces sp. NPDC058964]|uniref:CAP domain-containing protein n=1 Tax=Streptomyces sp. NPDC058964 TaxID=3346681 RepID=UPI003690C8D8
MGKHRKSTQYRRIVIAAVAVGAVGVPSAAMACTDWPGSGEARSYRAENVAAKDWWNDPNWGRPWNVHQGGRPSWTAPATPTPSASATKTTAPKPRATAHPHAPKTTAPKPRTTTAPGTRTATASTTPASPSTPKPTATASGVVARIVELVNAERGKAGCSPLTLNATLSKAAQAHSEDMALHQNMSHTGSNGSSPGDRITDAGYSWSAYGENVAYGYATPEDVMAGWMASPGHRENILNCTFKEIGVGLAQPNSYWTQDFGTAR